MNRTIKNLLKFSRILFLMQIFSRVGAIIGGGLSAISLIFMIRDWFLYCSFENQETRQIFLMTGIPMILLALGTSWAFKSAIQKYNKVIQTPIVLKSENAEEWLTFVRSSSKLKQLKNGVWFCRHNTSFIHDIYIVPENMPRADQPDFQEKCIVFAKERFHIHFRGTKRELSRKLTLFIVLQKTQDLGKSALWVDIDHYPEGGFRMTAYLDARNGRIQLPKIVGKIGTFLPNYSAGVECLLNGAD